MRSRIYFVLICIMICTGIAFGQEPINLTLDTSIKMALEKNPEVQIAHMEWAKAKAGIGEAWSALMPVVDGNVSLQHAWGEIQKQVFPNFLKDALLPLASVIPEVNDMPDFLKMSFGVENTFRYGLTLTQPLFLGGAGIAGVQLANAATKASMYEYEAKRQSLIHKTAGAFYGCLLAQRLVEVQSEALAQAEANLNNVIIKYDAGIASGFDKMRAQVEVANLKPEFIVSQNNYNSAITGLRMVLGLPTTQLIKVVGQLEYQPDSYNEFNLSVLQEKAMAQRPEMAMVQAQIRMASKGVTIAKSAFMPKLFFQTEYSYLGMRNDFNFEQNDMSRGFTSALSLQVPLFNGFKNAKQYQKARLDSRIVKDSRRQMENGINAEVEIALNKFNESVEKYNAANESIDLAKEALRLANLLYEEGASTQLDVLSSQLALTRARLNYASALFDYQIARYEIRRVTGELKGVL
ncbi:TolC family protein [bacterium]|nr:TolC family protein [bacterium]